MADYLDHMQGYWDGRFAGESMIWGRAPSTTAVSALARAHDPRTVFICASALAAPPVVWLYRALTSS